MSTAVVDRVRSVEIEGHNRLATLNLVIGKIVYGEQLVRIEGEEYRIWDPFRSKLAAAYLKGLSSQLISPGSRVLYLGASTGTTVSHVSDQIGSDGLLFAVEMAPRVARELIENVAALRPNVIPIIQDARKPDRYGVVFGKVDVVYCDIAQPDQTSIALANCHRFLAKHGLLMLVVKTRSIDVTKDPRIVVAEEARVVESSNYRVLKILDLEPYDKDHGFIVAQQEGLHDPSVH